VPAGSVPRIRASWQSCTAFAVLATYFDVALVMVEAHGPAASALDVRAAKANPKTATADEGRRESRMS